MKLKSKQPLLRRNGSELHVEVEAARDQSSGDRSLQLQLYTSTIVVAAGSIPRGRVLLQASEQRGFAFACCVVPPRSSRPGSSAHASSRSRDPARKRILLVDDHPLMRRGQADLINREPDMEVCGEAGTAREGIELVAKLRPDLALIDMALPDKDGLELIKDLRALHPEVPLLAMSMQDESVYAARVLRAGGRGYVMKAEGAERLPAAIRTVLAGQVAVSAQISAKLLASMVGTPGAASANAPEDKLTDRELEVLRLVGQGWSTDEIAERLHLSAKTVDVHRSNIRQKLGFKTRPELQRFAINWVAAQNFGGR